MLESLNASYRFIKHAKWVQIQRDMYPGESVRELQRLCDTRWACRYAACKAVSSRLPAVVRLLSDIEGGENAKRAVEARALLGSVDCHFVIMLCFMSDILGKTQSLSLFLQSATIDFSVADLIHAVCADLTELRSNDDKFNALYTEAVNLCEASGWHRDQF